ncbi:MAG: succinate CoA transferase [Akkermansia sp.]|nr:succinate CoA transferase [Akkermansiaceae bacterium]MBR1998770.1 succinate CoA transferase [Akkermansia sp.]MBR3695977.1 succinate CoA transferase [Akkermansia sp.]MBR3943468.1 succinate CoA transferase [Akkermansia sp.]
MRYKNLTAEEAAAMIEDGECIGVSGFTEAGAVKVVPKAIAEKAKAEHAAGRPFKLKVMCGASNSAAVDGELAAAEAVSMRMPYMSCPLTRAQINNAEVSYQDPHISLFAQNMRYGIIPRVKTAIVEACEVTDDGKITFTMSQGSSADFCLLADRIIIELNSYHKPCLKEIHDIFIPEDPPNRIPIPLVAPEEKIGTPYVQVDPEKIVGVVHTHLKDGLPPYRPGDAVTDKIGENVIRFLEHEYRVGRIPKDFLPIQSGVGNVANAVLAALGRSGVIPPVKMYTEVIQEAVIHLIKQGKITFASGCSLSVCDDTMEEIYRNFDYWKHKVLLRPTEMTNNPAVVRQLGLICMNTAIEADIFGNVNSTHLLGNKVMNGIGGSGDFARAAAITIFSCPSVAKGGSISAIVPMVSHVDHTEHDVRVLITEQGIADLRGKSPRQRAELIIENCAHPDYKPLLRRYVELTPKGHTPHNLAKAYAFHLALQETGDMRNVKL